MTLFWIFFFACVCLLLNIIWGGLNLCLRHLCRPLHDLSPIQHWILFQQESKDFKFIEQTLCINLFERFKINYSILAEEQRGSECVCVCVCGLSDGLSSCNLYVHNVCSDITGQRSLTHSHTLKVMHLSLFTRTNGPTNHSHLWLSDVIELMRKLPQRGLMSSHHSPLPRLVSVVCFWLIHSD